MALRIVPFDGGAVLFKNAAAPGLRLKLRLNRPGQPDPESSGFCNIKVNMGIGFSAPVIRSQAIQLLAVNNLITFVY